ncbi:MAG: hypothetical protein IKJ88_08775 [Clostridia bacterium]|nr:hypothetical protein [Clostridia bacterium]
MSNISEIDTNFKLETLLDIDNIKFYNILNEPFSLFGVKYENGLYRRLPEAVAKQVNDGVYNLHIHTAGGRIKFVTDSSFVAVKAVMPSIGKMPHFSLTGSAGFDMYTGRRELYTASFIPPFDMTDGFEAVNYFDSKKTREITINFPLYSAVSAVYIGLENTAKVRKSTGYKHEKPVVFYGSSITQGGCASRPGSSYQSIISRALHTDFINLGFSGSALAEDIIAEHISKLDMSVFVYDYDHNAPTVRHLENTHKKMFMKIREKQPDLPVIMLSRPKYILTDEEKQRLAIVEKTYTDAVNNGDKNVYFIKGTELMKYAKNEGTVDNCHPNDLGFYSMARVILPVLRKLIF